MDIFKKFDFSYVFSLCIFTISGLIILLKVWIFNEIVEFFDKGSEIGLICESLLLNLMASSIFFAFFSYTVENRSKKKMERYVQFQTDRLVKVGENILYHISSSLDTKFDLEDFGEDAAKECFSKIDDGNILPKLMDPHTGNWCSWFDLFHQEAIHTENTIRKIIDRSNFIDIETLEVVLAIEDCNFISFVSTLKNSPYRSNLKMANFTNKLPDFLNLLKKLKYIT